VAYTQPRILLSAYQCGPDMGSVSMIGWQWYARLAKQAPVTLVTHIRNHRSLTEAGAPLPNTEIIYIDTEWFAAPLHKLTLKLFPHSEHAVFLLSSLDFYLYDWVSVRKLKKRQKKQKCWDIVHVVTPVSPTTATRLHTLDIPLLLGPWNGGIKTLKQFSHIMRQDASWVYWVRALGRIPSALWGSTRKAAAILVANTVTKETIAPRYHSHCVAMLENGVDMTIFKPAPWIGAPSKNKALKLIFVGRLLPFKALPLLLDAVAYMKNHHPDYPVELTVIGDGALSFLWQHHAKKLNLNKEITWYGMADHDEVVKKIHQSHVLCLPSIRESGGAVLLEAMACARPVIAVDFGGPKDVVNNKVGCLVSAENDASVVSGFVHAFLDIFAQPDKWKERGEVGRQQAEKYYSWESKINYTMKLYSQFTQPQTAPISSYDTL